MEYPIIIHGSENSLDVDAYVVIPSAIEFKEAKRICDSYKDINANLIVIKNGVVSWCYKGTVDECNNSIVSTYHLHEQSYEIPIERLVSRSYALKLIRTVRGLLSYASRTEHREIVKKALKSSSLIEKVSVLSKIDISAINDFEKSSVVETYKFLAFQLGQTMALLEDNVELFTKNSVAAYYPELAVYLKREISTPNELSNFWWRFMSFIQRSFGKVEKFDWFHTKFHGVHEVFDCKAEIILPRVIVFDIDGTLMNEVHRSHLREAGRWEEYFDACDLDTPFQKIVDLTHYYKELGYEIWVMSGRLNTCLEKTIESLKKYGVYYDHLKLRGEGVFIPDYVLKPAWARKYIGIERIDAVYDDTPNVIEGFLKKGIRNVIDVRKLLVK